MEADAYQFHLQLRKQKTIAALTRLFRAAIAPFGFDTFACGELDLSDRDRTVYYVIDWPESWRKFYLSSKLVERDPLIDVLAYRREPFLWSDLPDDPRFGKVGREALDLVAKHGWVQGLVVPIPGGSGRVGLVSLVGTRAECTPPVRAYLALISLGFHIQVRSLITRQGFAVPPAGLTKREIASVRLVARGHSDASAARELGVAPSTAHEFIEKAKRRLKARTRVELIAIAVALGIVDI